MLSIVDLLVLISLDQLLFIFKILFTLVTEQATPVRMHAVLSLSPVSVPCFIHTIGNYSNQRHKSLRKVIRQTTICLKDPFTQSSERTNRNFTY
jgi:hypothetical protein